MRGMTTDPCGIVPLSFIKASLGYTLNGEEGYILNSGEFRTYVVMCVLADEDGRLAVTQKELAEFSGITPQSLRGHLRTLMKLAYITGTNRTPFPTLYRINNHFVKAYSEVRKMAKPTDNSAWMESLGEGEKLRATKQAASTGNVQMVWDAWRSQREIHYGRPNPSSLKLSGDRLAAIKRKLKDGYGVEHLMKAVRGIFLSKFHCGLMPGFPKEYLDLTTALKNGKNIDDFIELWDNRGKTNPLPIDEEELEARKEFEKRLENHGG